MTIGMFTSVEERCGIAAYSRGLVEALRWNACVRVSAASFEAMPVPPVRAPLPDAAEAKRRLGLEGRTVLTIFGFLARRKGYEVALAALRSLPPETLLLAAGGAHAADRGEPEAWLRAEAERLGV